MNHTYAVLCYDVEGAPEAGCIPLGEFTDEQARAMAAYLFKSTAMDLKLPAVPHLVFCFKSAKDPRWVLEQIRDNIPPDRLADLRGFYSRFPINASQPS